LTGRWRGQPIGSGTGVWQMSEEVRGGRMPQEEFIEAESCMHRSHGHCMTMGTASTMASMVEALGMGLPGNAAIPAVDGRRNVLARQAGRRAVAMVKQDLRMSQILTRGAFENAIRVLAGIGGSTNAVLHLIAIAGRVGIPLALEDFDAIGSALPCLVDLQPSGRFLMEDFFEAGGIPAVVREMESVIDKNAVTVNGQTLWENCAQAPCWNREVIRPWSDPFKPAAGIAVLRGNLAPLGAVIKPSAATPGLMQHRGRAVVFRNAEELHRKIEDPDLDVDEDCVLVLQHCGPKGYPGMPESGNMPIPKKLIERGVTDMVRVSDARMSGTAYGTVVLHVAPEAAAGGPLALVRDGDMIELDVIGRRLHLDVSEEELASRRAQWQAPPAAATRGYVKIYIDHVLQADRGADLDFLVGNSGSAVPPDNH
ncbi:MAG: dihydroxy-acid dehydratase, partial [Betaproteobacteria bacterium]|nr:dihydroxy-acid dehydratase [Betaproteobacteria bacterium]